MRFNHLTIFVSDYERSKAFYTTLGLIQIVDAPPRYGRFMFAGNDATFSIEVMPDLPVIPSPVSLIFFECDPLDATVAALQAKGIVFESDPTDMEYLWREARLRDPDGHEIALYAPGTNRLDPPWRMDTGVATE